jgi:hypothetical protein
MKVCWTTSSLLFLVALGGAALADNLIGSLEKADQAITAVTGRARLRF